MFLPYRTIGFVIDKNPPVLRKVGTRNHIYSTVGQSWQLHDGSKLRLRVTSPGLESQVAALAVTDKGVVCTAIGKQIVVWRGRQEAHRITPPDGNRIVKLLSLGNIIVSLSRDGHLYVWDLESIAQLFATSELVDAKVHGDDAAQGALSTDTFAAPAQITIPILSHAILTPPPSPFKQKATVKHQFGLESQTVTTVQDHSSAFITSWCHPPTYNNKLLIGWSNGVLELWNIRTGKMIHRFNSHYETKQDTNLKNSREIDAKNDLLKSAGLTPLDQTLEKQVSTNRITCLEASYVLDVVAIGKSNGDVVLLNLKLDQVIHIFNQEQSVTSLSFRTDNNFQHLISGGISGGISLWDLKEKSCIFRRQAHSDTITGAFFLYREPILITTGADNAISQWHFDGANMNQIRSVEGHHETPHTLRWYSHRELLTGAPDGTFRYWSPYRDRSAKSLSWKAIPTNAHRSEKGDQSGFLTGPQRAVNAIDLTPMYHANQPSAVTLNSGYTDKVTLWEVENQRATKLIGHSLAKATHTCFSFCGQFIFVGYEDGEVKKFNIQSGAARCTFTPDKKITTAHGDEEIETLTLTKGQKKRKRNMEIQSGSIRAKNNALGVNPHQNGIAGIFCGVGNEYLVSVGKDGIMYTWDIDREAMLRTLNLDHPIHSTHFAPDFSLLGVVTSSNEIFLIDCERLCIVRHWDNIIGRLDKILLHPHNALMFITDIMGGLRTYDLTSGMLIDQTIFSRPILSLDVCSQSRDTKSSGDMIATTHKGTLGVYLWILNPNRQLSTALTVHQRFMGTSTTSTPTNRIELATGNIALSIDSEALRRQQEKFQKEQVELFQLHEKEMNEYLLNSDDEDEDLKYTNMRQEDSDDDDDELNQNDGVVSHKLTKQEKMYYKKMKKSNHFLTVNVVRNMSMFDVLITKPKPAKADITIDEENDKDDVKLIKAQRVMQQVLFKQLHNEMNNRLSMLSGVAASRWKLLTQQQAIAQRNERVKQAQIMANTNSPFFLNIQTAQKKNDASTTYSLEKGTTLVEQEQAIRGAKNNQFKHHFGGMDGDDQPADLIQQCLGINTVFNIADFIWEKDSVNIFAGESDDDDDDDILVSVNDKKNKIGKNVTNDNNDDGKVKTKKEIAMKKLQEEKEMKAKMEAKLKKQQEKQRLLSIRRDKAAAYLRFLYLHILPTHPSQEWIEEYNSTHQNNQNIKMEKIEQTNNPFAAFGLNSTNKKSISNLITQVSKQQKGNKGKNIVDNKLAQLVSSSRVEKTTAEKHQEHVESIQQAYLTEIKDMSSKLDINVKLDKKSLNPLMSYILTTPPSLLSAQISAFEDERELYIFLHTIFIISTNLQGGLIDAVSSLMQHTLQQHSLMISESPLLRVLCNLLVKSMSSQWKQIEMLLHSNIAVVNHLAGLHSGL